MFLALIGFARGLTWKGWLAVAAVAAVVAILSTIAVGSIIDHFSDDKVVRENNKDRELREELSVQRAESETKITTEERQLNEELAKLPDAIPSDRRLLRACRELRDDGHSVLPSECGSATN
jgi:hypothetical protein